MFNINNLAHASSPMGSESFAVETSDLDEQYGPGTAALVNQLVLQDPFETLLEEV